MLNIKQKILNQVAKEPTPEYKITKHLFSQSQDQIDQDLEDLQKKFEPSFQLQNPDCPSEVLMMWYLEILPLYLDSQAISKYICRAEDLQLFNALPEILNPEEAVEIVSRETTLTKKDWSILLVAFQNSKDNFPRL
jgi:hypothetical protein